MRQHQFLFRRLGSDFAGTCGCRFLHNEPLKVSEANVIFYSSDEEEEKLLPNAVLSLDVYIREKLSALWRNDNSQWMKVLHCPASYTVKEQ